MNNFVFAVDAFDTLRSVLKSEDHWKINFCQQHEETYTALRRSLPMIGKIDGAFFASKQGLVQTFSDNLLIQYERKENIQFASYYRRPLKELELKFMKNVKIAHLGFTILLSHFMMQLLDPLLTCLVVKTTSWSLFLMVSCALLHGPQLLNGLGFALFYHL